MHSKVQVLWKSVVCTVLWPILLETNARAFGVKIEDMEGLWHFFYSMFCLLLRRDRQHLGFLGERYLFKCFWDFYLYLWGVLLVVCACHSFLCFSLFVVSSIAGN